MKQFLSMLVLSLILTSCGLGGNVASLCMDEGGHYLDAHKECEYVSKEWCDQAGGVFVECASSCRHDDRADVCVMQCVPLCNFLK